MVPQLGTPENKPQVVYGLMCWGSNPAVGGPSSSWERSALQHLDWLVCVDLWKTETAAFWEPDPVTGECIGIPGQIPANVGTTVYMLPASASFEKEGSVSNSSRLSQWRYKACDAPGEAMDDLSIINELGKRLIALYQADAPSLLRDPVANLYWGPYCNPGTGNVDFWGMDGSAYDDGIPDPRTGLLEANAHKVAKELNGYFCPGAEATVGTTVGKRVNGFFHATATMGTLREGGQTSSGNWLYCVMYPDPNIPSTDAYGSSPANGNRQEKRDPVEVARADGNYIGLFKNWAVCWPLNRRIIYNGASVYQAGHPLCGQPLAPSKWVLDFPAAGDPLVPGAGSNKAGGDVPDGYNPPGGSLVRYPFIMVSEGHARIFGGFSLEDGPFPEHYEPLETVLTENVISQTLGTPTVFLHARPERVEIAVPGNSEFPIIGTTYRLTEHWQAGAMTRNLPWLCELQPEAFVELSVELAGILDIENGDTVEIKTQRTNYYNNQTMMAKACVTKRLKTFNINGSPRHVIGAIWHFGYVGLATGESANLVTAHAGDANTGIPESKAFICNIRRNNGVGDVGDWLA